MMNDFVTLGKTGQKKKKKKKKMFSKCKLNQKLICLLSVSHRFRLLLKGWIGHLR
uniref:Sch1 n=1 Tax=Saccharomyces cerevisiae TaxID=4932 RepID=Q4PIX8_YEASX|nr:uORF [Saccharomyces cerevisiae]CAA40852.1 Sch1 [Saccharomyces cerevisiae]